MPKSEKPRRKTFIKEWRAFRKMSQEELAAAASMSPGNLSLLENDKISYTADSLERLADALDCTTVDLLTHDPAAGEDIWALLRDATPAERRQYSEILKVVSKGPKQ